MKLLFRNQILTLFMILYSSLTFIRQNILLKISEVKTNTHHLLYLYKIMYISPTVF